MGSSTGGSASTGHVWGLILNLLVALCLLICGCSVFSLRYKVMEAEQRVQEAYVTMENMRNAMAKAYESNTKLQDELDDITMRYRSIASGVHDSEGSSSGSGGGQASPSVSSDKGVSEGCSSAARRAAKSILRASEILERQHAALKNCVVNYGNSKAD